MVGLATGMWIPAADIEGNEGLIKLAFIDSPELQENFLEIPYPELWVLLLVRGYRLSTQCRRLLEAQALLTLREKCAYTFQTPLLHLKF